MSYNTDVGHGIRIKEHPAEPGRPAGFVVEIHFYDKKKAADYAARLIVREAKENNAI
jgi:hypothetical protein